APLERSFVLLTLKHLRSVFAEIARNKQTTGLGHVTIEDLRRLKVVRPAAEILPHWNDIVGPLIERAFLGEIENQILATLRDSLLPKLLSGELPLAAEREH